MLNVRVESFGYGDQDILGPISLDVAPGEHVALMGESGSGKSTLLKIIYGLLHLEQGSVFWGDRPALGPNFNLIPGEPYMKYLAQDFDLMPFITVEENIGQFLSVFERETHGERIAQLLDLIDMGAFAKTRVQQLSGGQQQRVALARVLAQEPEVLLLDEPFGHIDSHRRNSLRRKLFPYLREKGVTVLTATHDLDDVLPYAQRIMVLEKGRAIAYQKTKKLYLNPPDPYTASLFGEVSLLPMVQLKSYSKLDRSILIYPHEFQVSKTTGLKVTVEHSFFKGGHYLNQGRTDQGDLLYFNTPKKQQADSTVFLNVSLKTINERIKFGQRTTTEGIDPKGH